MSMLYYHSEALHYAVIGTPNKHEVEKRNAQKIGRKNLHLRIWVKRLT